MKVFKAFTKIIYYLVIVLLIVFIALRIFIPRKMDNIVNYKFYTVLTNSMEPRIPTYSLVCVKNFKEDELVNLKPQQIITFHANRFGDPIIITHHFNKTERDKDGNIIYRTNAEGKTNLDVYETKRSDLIGTYVFHIPYVGKVPLFFKSKFVFIWLGELVIIFLINILIRLLWGDKLNEPIKLNKKSRSKDKKINILE
ncbi:signal peptidase I [Clostridium sp. SM-530-WT-3G]|uniref:signal peptidase I n=1 Tax=Clostridium sp. SM-530-WT-3G TaxID=2725303 RepID=UPI00145ED2AF|nr:signal peptidase I [Clostridium sp. SM-530-WT-3G]NME82607.1 signal peptidase I [Clostridium sp. SM-530-WT-3G]